MNSVRRGPIVFCSVAAISACALFGQSVPLNPTVKVLPNARTVVPADCFEGGARVPVIAEAAPPPLTAATAPAPPSADLRSRIRRVQSAAERDDRDEFKAALADARAAVGSYPTGGERDAANEVIQVYSDLEKIWDYAFASPSGAFFDAGSDGGSLINIVRRYPDYNRFIKDSTLTIGGQTVYPTRETRRFLVAEATKRLTRLGVRMPTRVAERPPVVPAPTPVPKTTSKPPASKPATSVARTTPAHRRPMKKKSEAATVAPPLKPPTTTTAQAGLPAPHRETPTTTTPPPEKVPPPPTTTSAPLVARTTTAAPATTTTSEISQPADSTTVGQQQQPTGGRMNLLFAVILIIVGIGVLIVLFRASD
jgi:hypothetical protein